MLLEQMEIQPQDTGSRSTEFKILPSFSYVACSISASTAL